MRIGVVAPARGIDRETADRVIDFAATMVPNARLVIHPQCLLSDGHFAGTDAERAAAFLDVANDPHIDAVWFARGGYGSNRIVPAVMANLTDAAARKTYLGYSDAGFLLAALFARGIGQAVHGPMLADINRAGGEAAVARALSWLTMADRGTLETGLGGRPHAVFNLTILAGLVGTPWLPDLRGHVVVIEEVSEPLYRIDRMLCQIARATDLRGVAGLRLGRISDVTPNDPPWGEKVAAMVDRWCTELGVPYLGTADVGHDVANKIVPFGIA